VLRDEPWDPLPSIRSQITLLVLACALPALIGLGLLILHFYRLEHQQATTDGGRMSRALAAAVDRDLRIGESVGLALASSPSLQVKDFSAFRAQVMAQLRPGFPAHQIVLQTPDGQHVVNSLIPEGLPLPRAANAARLKKTLDSGKPRLSDLFVGSLSKRPLFAYDIPVHVHGGTAYVLSIVYLPETLGRIIAEQKLSPNVTVMLLDARGAIVARSSGDGVGKLADPSLLQHIGTEHEGTMNTAVLAGTPVYASFSRAPDSGWTVVVTIPESDLVSDLKKFTSLISAGILVLLGAGFLLAWSVGGGIGRSVRALIEPARALAAGTPVMVQDLGFREAREVADALQQVEGDIMRHRNELESLVAERTAQLADSKALLENVYATAPVGLSFVDPDLKVVMINEYLAAVNAAPVNAHIGRSFGELISDDKVRHDVRLAYEQVLRTGQPIVDVPLSGASPARPGRINHYLTGYYPVFAADGRLVGITGLLLDITAQKQTEAALRQSRQMFRSVVEHMPALIFVKRASDLRYEMLNREFERLMGRPRGDMLGKSDYDLFPPAEANRFAAGDRATLAAGDVQELPDEEITSADGAVHIVATRKVVLRGEDGQVSHVLGMAVDMTERRRADDALRNASLQLARSNAFLRTVTDNLPGMVTYWDKDLICHFANKFFLTWIGVTPEQAIGAPAHELLNAELIERLMPRVQAVLAGEPQNFTREAARPDGQKLYLWVNYLPDLDPRGEVRGFFMLASDVTEIKRSALQAEAASRAKSEFVANMSHEIRTPMNAIIGLARLLEEAPLERRERSYVSRIQLATQALLGVVNDVLVFSRIEAGQLQLELNTFRLDHILGSTAVLTAGAAWDKGLEPVFDIDPLLPPQLEGDAMRLQQILVNLLSNAIKFTARGEVVLTVRLARSEAERRWLTFSVRDTGIGIAPEQQARMFDAFTQGDNSTSRQYGGAGLGLSISRRLAGLMDGEITVESTPGAGATFCLTVPLRVAAGTEPERSIGEDLRRLRVLVVDDNPSALQAITAAGSAWQWQMYTAASGAEALAQLRQLANAGQALDLLIIDSAMPELDGISMLTQARAEHSAPLPPVVITASETASEDLLQLADGLDIGDVLAKPWTPAKLCTAIRGALSGQREVSEQQRHTPLSGRLPGLRVLLVEDNEINQEMAQYILLHTGARVEIAANGKIAVDMLAEHPARCDAVLMDLQMPVMNGFEATAAIRALGLVRLPIVAMTANAMQEDRARALEAGVDDHIAKPIDVETLIATLTRLVPGMAAGAAPAAAIEASGRPETVPGIDLDTALNRMAGNYPAFVGLLKRFENSQGGAVAEVRALLASHGPEQAALTLHRLRGVAANLGAVDVARLAARTEAALHERDEAALAMLLPALEQAIGVVTDAARTLPLPLQPASPDKGQRMNLVQGLEELVSLLRNNNLKALSSYQTLRPALEEYGAVALPALSRAIETLDFPAAEQMVATLLKRMDTA
jgi:two-component system sensor histidine kinase/response regulator